MLRSVKVSIDCPYVVREMGMSQFQSLQLNKEFRGSNRHCLIMCNRMHTSNRHCTQCRPKRIIYLYSIVHNNTRSCHFKKIVVFALDDFAVILGISSTNGAHLANVTFWTKRL